MNRKLDKLSVALRRHRKVLVAFSGGVDSSFLAVFARQALGKENVLAVTAVSETYPSAELRTARMLAKRFDLRHMVIHTGELKNRDFIDNPPERCFYCKNELFAKLTALAHTYHMKLCDATNYDDRTDYRPGRKAAAQWKVASPLFDAAITKTDIRAFSKEMKLPTWNRPAQACLASRIPSGTAITAGELKRIEKGEAYLAAVIPGIFRLRHHGEIARIEMEAPRIAALFSSGKAVRIAERLRKLGWRYVSIDIDGYRTGSMNAPAAQRRRTLDRARIKLYKSKTL